MAERFLLPTLNEQSRGPVSTISASYKQRDTDHIIVSEGNITDNAHAISRP